MREGGGEEGQRGKENEGKPGLNLPLVPKLLGNRSVTLREKPGI